MGLIVDQDRDVLVIKRRQQGWGILIWAGIYNVSLLDHIKLTCLLMPVAKYIQINPVKVSRKFMHKYSRFNQTNKTDLRKNFRRSVSMT